LASTTSWWAQSRTWPTEPGAAVERPSAIVWMLSTTTRLGSVRSIAVTVASSDVSAAIHSSGRTAPSRSARSRTCCGLSSALT
jgi:hypothetical protein